ncbi:MAG: peptidoglycan-binding protein [Verrucomicrobiota bacterium]|nr:peptidoglycan-binding protein [Verrucomicrobiota bacterium]
MRWLFLALILVVSTVLADEQVRQVQEELRKRNLYFGDIDGQTRPELNNAVRRYQARKGFAVTGTIDDETAISLNVKSRSITQTTSLPDVPILRSDAARQLPPEQRIALEKEADLNPDLVPTPAPPAEAPASENSSERIRAFIQQYLRDSETDDIATQTKYFNYPVIYFDHGVVDSAFVHKDVTNYVKRWPQRKYELLDPIDFIGATDGRTEVRFPITFQVRNKNHTASGRTMNFWTLRAEGDDLKIIAISEQRLRE